MRPVLASSSKEAGNQLPHPNGAYRHVPHAASLKPDERRLVQFFVKFCELPRVNKQKRNNLKLVAERFLFQGTYLKPSSRKRWRIILGSSRIREMNRNYAWVKLNRKMLAALALRALADSFWPVPHGLRTAQRAARLAHSTRPIFMSSLFLHVRSLTALRPAGLRALLVIRGTLEPPSSSTSATGALLSAVPRILKQNNDDRVETECPTGENKAGPDINT